ncbi:alpha/beta fold hydrolase BchO [Rhodopseudomonas palustris]|uniref:alpha/beta fold hydrolase BchO n=1 Tax=Rhodopseudomonas palustris TaxID=1076 RepID=UPI0021F2D3C5|nr:alpha/beta fold hydrolase BchO [Rhodopseudomonas palustris]UYO54178.1 alpha/beta fold hydrolase [Rhodopseudomonas palustris]
MVLHPARDTLKTSSPRPSRRHHPKPDWQRDGGDWPHRDRSRFVEAAGLRWHVQQMGRGPTLLLLHGTGAATHSWRDLAPLLAEHFTVIAPDLPGHGFTETPERGRMSLHAMAEDIDALLGALGQRPALVAGHSAGVAVLARMCLAGLIAPSGLVSLNGALLPIGGRAGRWMLPLARVLAGSAMVPRLVARFARTKGMVERMIADTGSSLNPGGIELYRGLVCSPGHVAAALTMMASWRLEHLAAELPRLTPRLLLVAGSNDKTIASTDAERVQAMVPGARSVIMPGLGHLAHEERPQDVAGLMVEFARELGALPPALAAAE